MSDVKLPLSMCSIIIHLQQRWQVGGVCHVTGGSAQMVAVEVGVDVLHHVHVLSM